jgi:hypothetical protein
MHTSPTAARRPRRTRQRSPEACMTRRRTRSLVSSAQPRMQRQPWSANTRKTPASGRSLETRGYSRRTRNPHPRKGSPSWSLRRAPCSRTLVVRVPNVRSSPLGSRRESAAGRQTSDRSRPGISPAWECSSNWTGDTETRLLAPPGSSPSTPGSGACIARGAASPRTPRRILLACLPGSPLASWHGTSRRMRWARPCTPCRMPARSTQRRARPQKRAAGTSGSVS